MSEPALHEIKRYTRLLQQPLPNIRILKITWGLHKEYGVMVLMVYDRYGTNTVNPSWIAARANGPSKEVKLRA